ncbi:hypothetical protein VTH06DRAFT_4697, partial [Thermothelomyces fergusii]
MFGKSRRKQQQRRHHLLRIPGEIRNQIYSDLLLSSPHAIPIFRGDADKKAAAATEEVLSVLTALLRTCRQIHREAGTLFYSRAHFALPPDASRAPHQAQANLLFRAFLDRIGPHNAALIRHLTIPFPVDPDLFLQRASEEARREPESGHRADEQQWRVGSDDDDDDDDDDDTHPASSLISALRRRCPAIETLTFDLRRVNSWAWRLILLLNVMAATTTRPRAKPAAQAAAARRLFGPVDALLRAAFPRLRRVNLLLGAGAYRTQWTDPVMPDEAAQLRALLGGEEWEEGEEDKRKRKKTKKVMTKDGPKFGCEWNVAIEDERAMTDGGPSNGIGTWHGPPRTPRHAIEMLYALPGSAIRLELEARDDWTAREWYAPTSASPPPWLRSPTRAVLDREE